MNTSILQYFSIISIPLVLFSCQPKDPHKIIGKWSGEDGKGNKQIFLFKNDDTALWIFNPTAKADTFNLDYRISYSTSPAELDLSGFDRGFLKDKTLYGIVEFVHGDTFRVDFEPGPVDTIPKNIRPRSFTEQTVTYSKLE